MQQNVLITYLSKITEPTPKNQVTRRNQLLSVQHSTKYVRLILVPKSAQNGVACKHHDTQNNISKMCFATLIP